ncbi:MAG: hypothetical protein CVU11_13385 [Bacteroidetes bacterium HGW-Bacteroidetes-6]|jgi:hypothetical protein|nr:MAG: hypothetical protein CVU11_13385 [Bacteroidetes bacterium HGW-Bacteroidetes-6]
MKPAKGLFPFAAWLIRITMLVFAYTIFFEIIKTFDFSSLDFYIAAAFAFFSVLLFVGGFMSKPAMTVLSAFFLFGLSVYKFAVLFSKEPNLPMLVFLMSMSAMLMMFSVGNKK